MQCMDALYSHSSTFPPRFLVVKWNYVNQIVMYAWMELWNKSFYIPNNHDLVISSI